MASAAIPYPWHQICAQEKSQKEDMFKRRKPRPKIASGNHDTTMESKGSHQMIRLMAPRTPKHHSWTHPQVFLPCLGCWGLQLLHPALNASLPAVSPRESHRASPAQPSSWGKRNQLEAALVLEAFCCRRAGLCRKCGAPKSSWGAAGGGCDFASTCSAHSMEMRGSGWRSAGGSCCRNRLQCQCWLNTGTGQDSQDQLPTGVLQPAPAYSSALQYLIWRTIPTRNGKAAGHQQLPQLLPTH